MTLSGDGYILRDRGEIEVKGKGLMNTFFLIGKDKIKLKEPKDDFKDLPILHSSVNEQSNHGIKTIDSISTIQPLKSEPNSKSFTCMIM